MFQLIKDIVSILSVKNRIKAFMIIVGLTFMGLLDAVGIGAIWPLMRYMSDEQFFYRHLPMVEKVFSAIGANTYTDKIMICCVLLILFYILKGLLIVVINRQELSFSLENQKEYGVKLLLWYLKKPYLFHIKTNSSTLITNMTGGVNSVFSCICVEFFRLSAELCSAIMIVIMLLYMDSFIAIFLAVTFSVMVYAVLRTVKNTSKRIGTERIKYSSEYMKWLSQSLKGIKETKIQSKENFFAQSYGSAYQMAVDCDKKKLLLDILPRTFIENMIIVLVTVIIGIKLLLGGTPEMIVPSLGVLALSAFRLMPCANRAIQGVGTIRFCAPSFYQLFEDFKDMRKAEDEEKAKASTSTLRAGSDFKEIDIKDISFRYDKKSPVVWEHVSFSIKQGQFVGLIGTSGAGKTTFADTFLGLLKPLSGDITVDGESIYKDVAKWQRRFGYVSQQIYLIDGTVAENVAFGETEDSVDRDRVETVLRMAELWDVVQGLPKGMDSDIGEDGTRLSGGQRQRLGIARALYTNPEILVLDEATSALDTETEKKIIETVHRLKGRITIVAIAHRLSTLEDCDFKVKFTDGRVTVVDDKR